MTHDPVKPAAYVPVPRSVLDEVEERQAEWKASADAFRASVLKTLDAHDNEEHQ